MATAIDKINTTTLAGVSLLLMLLVSRPIPPVSVRLNNTDNQLVQELMQNNVKMSFHPILNSVSMETEAYLER